MRLLHTADWHLGRVLHGARLIEDQAHLLDELARLAADFRPDAIVVAGDVYDRAVPPPDAVRLLDDALTRLAAGCGCVLVIAGNHDGPERLAFGARLLAARGVHLAGLPEADPAPIGIADGHGPVALVALPYVDPAFARQLLADDALLGHDAATAALAARALAAAAAAAPRRILVGHAFVQGGLESESERPLTVGGSGAVAPERFAGFDYVALGHLHRPQSAGNDGRLRYAGSLMAYSFGEASGPRSVALVELDAAGGLHIETAALSPRRALRVIEGEFATLLAGPGPGASRDDYVLARLTDRGPVFDAAGRLREVYPNLLHLERPGLLEAAGAAGGGPALDHRRLDDLDLMAEFFRQTTGEPPTAAERAACAEVLAELRRGSPDEAA